MSLINPYVVKEKIIDAVINCVTIYSDCDDQLQRKDIPNMLQELSMQLDKILNDENLLDLIAVAAQQCVEVYKNSKKTIDYLIQQIQVIQVQSQHHKHYKDFIMEHLI